MGDGGGSLLGQRFGGDVHGFPFLFWLFCFGPSVLVKVGLFWECFVSESSETCVKFCGFFGFVSVCRGISDGCWLERI